MDSIGQTKEAPLKVLHALLALVALCVALIAWAEEPDHAIHEELRGILREVVTAMNSGQYDKMLPYLTENVEATSITQEVMSDRAEVSKYFQEWFGPTAYMRRMEIKLEADKSPEPCRPRTPRGSCSTPFRRGRRPRP